MATIQDIGLYVAINILGVVVFLLAFAFLRLQPINVRVYFPKWYMKGSRESSSHGGTLKMPEDELISHAGLDSAVYLRIYLVGYVTCIPCTSSPA